MNNSQNNKTSGSTKSHKQIKHANVLESLKDLGGSVSKSTQKDLLEKMPQDVIKQVMGGYSPAKYSGEISVGETVEMREVFSGQHTEKKRLEKHILFERRLREEEEAQIERRTNELRVQLQALMKEVFELSQVTTDLGEETKIATMQAPIEPGVYHMVFFEKLLEFIKSFRKKIQEASIWLHAANKRANKKNYWARYKKSGAKFLLSGEHYLTRSAG